MLQFRKMGLLSEPPLFLRPCNKPNRGEQLILTSDSGPFREGDLVTADGSRQYINMFAVCRWLFQGFYGDLEASSLDFGMASLQWVLSIF